MAALTARHVRPKTKAPGLPLPIPKMVKATPVMPKMLESTSPLTAEPTGSITWMRGAGVTKTGAGLGAQSLGNTGKAGLHKGR